VDLLSSQIALMGSAPVEFVPGQVGKVPLFIAAAIQATDGTIPFIPGSTMNLVYTGQADPLTTGVLYLTSKPLASPNTFTYAPQESGDSLPYPRTFVAGVGISAATVSDDPSGAINVSALNAGGVGWSINDTFTVDGGITGHEATGIVRTVSGTAIATYLPLTGSGAGYIPAVGVTLTPTSCALTCTGGKINISTITPANGTARVWITYQVLTLP